MEIKQTNERAWSEQNMGRSGGEGVKMKGFFIFPHPLPLLLTVLFSSQAMNSRGSFLESPKNLLCL